MNVIEKNYREVKKYLTSLSTLVDLYDEPKPLWLDNYDLETPQLKSILSTSGLYYSGLDLYLVAPSYGHSLLLGRFKSVLHRDILSYVLIAYDYSMHSRYNSGETPSSIDVQPTPSLFLLNRVLNPMYSFSFSQDEFNKLGQLGGRWTTSECYKRLYRDKNYHQLFNSPHFNNKHLYTTLQNHVDFRIPTWSIEDEDLYLQRLGQDLYSENNYASSYDGNKTNLVKFFNKVLNIVKELSLHDKFSEQFYKLLTNKIGYYNSISLDGLTLPSSTLSLEVDYLQIKINSDFYKFVNNRLAVVSSRSISSFNTAYLSLVLVYPLFTILSSIPDLMIEDSGVDGNTINSRGFYRMNHQIDPYYKRVLSESSSKFPYKRNLEYIRKLTRVFQFLNTRYDNFYK